MPAQERPDDGTDDFRREFDRLPRPASWYVTEALYEAQLMGTGIPLGLPTGFDTLDSVFRLREGQLIVIAARSSMGKTSLALQIAMHNALLFQAMGEDGCVVFFSAEMSGAELFSKMASARSGANLQRGYAGQWTPAETQAFQQELHDLSDIPLIVNDLTAIKTQDMVSGLSLLRNAGRTPRMIVFDYIELGADDDKFKEHERVAQIVTRLKVIAREANIPVLALSQVNRDLEKESRHRMPLMHNLAGSDAVGRTADKVLTLMTPANYLNTGVACACQFEEDSLNTAYVSIQKDRFGMRGTTYRLVFDPMTASFRDLDETDPRGRVVTQLNVRTAEDIGRWKERRAKADVPMSGLGNYKEAIHWTDK